MTMMATGCHITTGSSRSRMDHRGKWSTYIYYAVYTQDTSQLERMVILVVNGMPGDDHSFFFAPHAIEKYRETTHLL